MSEEKQQPETIGVYNHRQQLFLRYVVLILIDLTVIGLLNQYWDYVFIETFSIALLTAVLLQFLMQVAIKVEHSFAYFLETKMGLTSTALRIFSTWVIIFISKLVILEAINLFFGDSVVFSGPIDGLVAFLITVIVIIIAEQTITWIYRSLADSSKSSKH